MKIQGIITENFGLWLETPAGKYRIHQSERLRLERKYATQGLNYKGFIGLPAQAEDAPDIYPPSDSPLGWVKNGTLEIIGEVPA